MRTAVLAFLLIFSAYAGADDLSKPIALIQAGKFETAAVQLRAAIERSPAKAELWNLLGICESELNHPVPARTAFERGLTLAPNSTGLNENLGLLNFKQGDHVSAKRYLSEAIRLGAGSPGVRFSLAASRIRTGERSEGLTELLSLEADLSNQPDYWAERGWAEIVDKPKAATASFDRALKLAPNHVRALNGAASAAEKLNDDELALSYLLRAKKASPDDVRTLLHFGAVCLRRDLTVDGRAALLRARELAPSNNLVVFLLARTELSFQQWQKSHELFQEFDRRVPGYAPTHYALGWLDLKMNQPEEARAHLIHSLSIAPDAVEVLYELGQLDLNENHLEAAEERLNAALAKNDRYAKAHVALGDLMLKRNRIPDAKAHYEKAIAFEPNVGSAHYKLAGVLLRMNETDRAAKERALGASLNAEATKIARTVLLLANPDGSLLTDSPGER